MLKTLALTATFGLLTLPAMAADLIRKDSPHSVATTMDRLEMAVKGAGATVFARVNHGAGARNINMKLADAEVLIFGNPKLGTPALQADITSGLDLPLRVLVHATETGQTQIVYRAPTALSDDHNIPSDAKPIQMMTGALDKLTNKASSAD